MLIWQPCKLRCWTSSAWVEAHFHQWSKENISDLSVWPEKISPKLHVILLHTKKIQMLAWNTAGAMWTPAPRSISLSVLSPSAWFWDSTIMSILSFSTEAVPLPSKCLSSFTKDFQPPSFHKTLKLRWKDGYLFLFKPVPYTLASLVPRLKRRQEDNLVCNTDYESPSEQTWWPSSEARPVLPGCGL